MRRSRKYTKKIQLWNTAPVSDTFGGNTVAEFLVTSLWAELSTLNKFKYRNLDFGDIDMANSVAVTIRYRSDLNIDYKNMFIVYNGYKYSFTENSIDVDFKKNEFTFVMLKQNKVINQAVYLDIYSKWAKSLLNIGGVISSRTCVQSQLRNIL